jgi:DNA-directed RNA polymerase specialized sigma24 family protein
MLLRAIAAGVPDAAQDYDTLLYPIIYGAVKQRGRLLASQAARLTGTDGIPVPAVPACDVDWIANDVAVHALEHARATARRFDPARGDGVTWALRAAAFSYVDVVRATYGTRRALTIVPTDDEQLRVAVDAASATQDPAVIVEQRAALDAALEALTPDERFVVLATIHYGMSYAETAQLLFGDAGQVRRIDRLRQSARRSLAEAEQRWRAGSSTRRSDRPELPPVTAGKLERWGAAVLQSLGHRSYCG